MKTLRLSILVYLLLFSCTSKQPKPEVPAETPVPEKIQFTKGEVLASVRCNSDASQSYALYLPSTYSDTARWPVIIFFDPHGEGSLPLKLYRSLAEKTGTILIGSNTSKNGLTFDQTNLLVQKLVEEAFSRFSVDAKRISLAGFSGGAKVAMVASSGLPDLLAVIYCGATVPLDGFTWLPPALGIAGTSDMNYLEVSYSSQQLTDKKLFHALIEWGGGHEWPDSGTFEYSFFWSDFQAMRNKTLPINQHTIDLFRQKINRSLAEKNTAMERYHASHNAQLFLKDLADNTFYRTKQEAIGSSQQFKVEMQKQKELLALEGNLKTSYLQCFENKNLAWWQEEIGRMRRITGSQEMLYKRLLGYLSLAAYSYSNNAIRQNNFSVAEQFLGIYKLADPENSEQPFLAACMYARQGDTQKAVSFLREAIRMGLKDKSKIESEESLNSIRSLAEYNDLLTGL